MTPTQHDLLDALQSLARQLRAAGLSVAAERHIADALTARGIESIDQLTVAEVRGIVGEAMKESA